MGLSWLAPGMVESTGVERTPATEKQTDQCPPKRGTDGAIPFPFQQGQPKGAAILHTKGPSAAFHVKSVVKTTLSGGRRCRSLRGCMRRKTCARRTGKRGDFHGEWTRRLGVDYSLGKWHRTPPVADDGARMVIVHALHALNGGVGGWGANSFVVG
uniref:Uncharacterized protein n=1 Tax=Eutreptiella gymnastica TaxID=73025 RepID=A0A7S1HWX5_9EUGL